MSGKGGAHVIGALVFTVSAWVRRASGETVGPSRDKASSAGKTVVAPHCLSGILFMGYRFEYLSAILFMRYRFAT
jgi:hypothetical protein